MKFLNIALVIASATASALRRRVPSLLQASGECGDGFCTANYAPVCGSDGVTYTNGCVFGIAACEYAAANEGAAALTSTVGECIATVQCPEYCPLNYDPVCGSDGVTYSNGCAFGIASCNYANENPGAVALTSTEGACELEDTAGPTDLCSTLCTEEYAPVCGSDGETYVNLCFFDIAACEYAAANEGAFALTSTEGACSDGGAESESESEEADCFCSFVYDPVCGSNDETYGNACALDCAAADSLTEITTACAGVCPCAE